MEKDPKKIKRDAERPKIVIERDIYSDSENQVGLLKELGAKFCPDGFKYEGAFAVFIYGPKSDLATREMSLVEVRDSGKLSEFAVSLALTELGRGTMKIYGKRPPRKLNDPKVIETHK